jgi:RES domain-containing protein
MIVYRLTREIYKNDLSGKGASIKGGRWNSTGIYILYTAENRSLAMAEVAVHLSLEFLPNDFHMVEIFIPDKAPLLKISEHELSKYWNSYRLKPFDLKKIGNNFIKKNNYLLLKVPSAVTKGDYNILINPNHDLFDKVKVINTEIFPFDHRIFQAK